MAIIVAVPAPIPAVIMFNMAAFAIPIACVEAFTIVAGTYPACALIRRTAPVSRVPFIVTTDGIPVSIDPDEAGAGCRGSHGNHPGRRGRANSDPNRNLAEHVSRGQKHYDKQFSHERYDVHECYQISSY